MSDANLPQDLLNKLLRMKDIIGKLKNIAMKDGKITDEERSLILSIGHNVERYISVFKQTEKPSDEELHIIQKKILQDAHAKAFEDGLLSNDEKRLLTELITLMESSLK